MKITVENYKYSRFYFVRYSYAVLMLVQVENAHITRISVSVVNTEFEATCVKFTTLKEARAFCEIVSKGVIK